MAMQQVLVVSPQLLGDGASTTFVFNPSKMFEVFLDAGVLGNLYTPAIAASIVGVPGGWPAGQSATVDSFGNVTLTFVSAPPATQGYVQVQLTYASGNLPTVNASWTSATAANTTLVLPLYGSPTMLMTNIVTGTISAGTIGYQVSSDNVNWFSIQGVNPSGFQPSGGFNLTSGNTAVLFNVQGYNYFRVLLNPAITGTGTAAITLQGIAFPSVSPVVSGMVATYNAAGVSPASGGVSPVQMDGFGNVFVNNTRRSQVVPVTGNIASATPATMVAAQGAGIFADLSSLVLTLREGATANVFFAVLISDGTNTYRYNFMSQDVTTFQSSSPLAISFEPPIPASAANTAWTIALSSATDTPSVDYVATFVKEKAE